MQPHRSVEWSAGATPTVTGRLRREETGRDTVARRTRSSLPPKYALQRKATCYKYITKVKRPPSFMESLQNRPIKSKEEMVAETKAKLQRWGRVDGRIDWKEEIG